MTRLSEAMDRLDAALTAAGLELPPRGVSAGEARAQVEALGLWASDDLVEWFVRYGLGTVGPVLYSMGLDRAVEHYLLNADVAVDFRDDPEYADVVDWFPVVSMGGSGTIVISARERTGGPLVAARDWTLDIWPAPVGQLADAVLAWARRWESGQYVVMPDGSPHFGDQWLEGPRGFDPDPLGNGPY